MERVSMILEKGVGDVGRYLMAKSFSKDGKDGKDDITPPWLESHVEALIAH
jgi:hypothetical protein